MQIKTPLFVWLSGLIPDQMRAVCAGAGAPNIPFPTFGGLQVWTDFAVRRSWRIQRNAFTGHYRLLSPKDVRLAWGSRSHCSNKLAEFCPATGEKDTRPVVMLVHSLGGWRHMLNPLRQALETAGFCVETFAYASTFGAIEDHAAALERVLNRLDDVSFLSFATNSLGGPVVAAALARRGNWRHDIRVRSIAMMGPPNQGAVMARIASRVPFLRWLIGPSLQNLREWRSPVSGFGDIPVLVIAGNRGEGRGWNPLIGGENDGLVAMRETRLDIPHERIELRAVHGLFMNRPVVTREIVGFIRRAESEAAESQLPGSGPSPL